MAMEFSVRIFLVLRRTLREDTGAILENAVLVLFTRKKKTLIMASTMKTQRLTDNPKMRSISGPSTWSSDRTLNSGWSENSTVMFQC